MTNAAGCGSHLKDARPRAARRRHLRGARAPGTSPELHPLELPRRLPGVLPPRPRPARARGAAGAAPLDPGLELARAGRAGALLRQRGDLQPRPARSRARTLGDRKADEGARDRARRLRQREPGLSAAGLGGASARRPADPRRPPGRAARRRRSGASSRPAPPLDGRPRCPLTGGCLCGGVRFEVTEPLVSASWCHCTRCQRRTGTLGLAAGAARPRLAARCSRARSSSAPSSRRTGSRRCSARPAARACGAGAPTARTISVRFGVFDSDPGISAELPPVRRLRARLGHAPGRRPARASPSGVRPPSDCRGG